MTVKAGFCLGFVLPFFLLGVPAMAKDSCLNFGKLDVGPNAAVSIVSSNVIRVLDRAGICIRIRIRPTKRMFLSLQSGDVDGELARASSYAEAVAAFAVPVPEPLVSGTGYLLTREDGVEKVSDLGQGTLGVLRGGTWHALAASGHEPVFVANTYEQLAEMMAAGRIEAILIDELTVQAYPHLAGFNRVPVIDLSAYVYLRKECAWAIPAIQEAIRAFKRSGCRFEAVDGGPDCKVAE